MRRARFAAFVKLAKAPGCYLSLADTKLTKGERQHMEALTDMVLSKNIKSCGSDLVEGPIARKTPFGQQGIELTVAGIKLFNHIVESASVEG
jgi:hypothetical protein